MNWKKAAVVVIGNAYSLGSLVLIGWGIFRFFKGIHIDGTPDVGGKFLEIPWSPFFMGFTDGTQYFFVGAESLGTLFFPGVELLAGFPIPVIWPVFLGGFLLWGWPIVKDPLLRFGGLTSAAGREHNSSQN